MMRRILRFGTVGMLNSVVGFAVIYACLTAGFGDFASNAIGYAFGLMLSFFLNRRWTFADRTGSVPRDAFGFLVAWITAYLINLGVLGLGRSFGWIENPLVHLFGVLVFAGAFYLLTSRIVFVGSKNSALFTAEGSNRD